MVFIAFRPSPFFSGNGRFCFVIFAFSRDCPFGLLTADEESRLTDAFSCVGVRRPHLVADVELRRFFAVRRDVISDEHHVPVRIRPFQEAALDVGCDDLIAGAAERRDVTVHAVDGFFRFKRR